MISLFLTEKRIVVFNMKNILCLKKSDHIVLGTTGRLENIKRSELRLIDLIKQMKFFRLLRQWLDFYCHLQAFTNTGGGDDTTIGIPEGQLLVPLIIVIDHNRVEVMQLDK